jgi:hypothetical protein
VEYPVNFKALFIVIYLVKHQIVSGDNPAVFLVPFIRLVHPGVIGGMVKTFFQNFKKPSNRAGVEP